MFDFKLHRLDSEPDQPSDDDCDYWQQQEKRKHRQREGCRHRSGADSDSASRSCGECHIWDDTHGY